MKRNKLSLFCENNTVSTSQKISTSTLGVLVGVSSGLITSTFVNQNDLISIGNGETHPISMTVAVISAILAKNLAYKLSCNTKQSRTTAALPKLDCNDKIRSLTVRYLITALFGILFGLLLSFILTMFIPDDEVILRHSSHLVSSGVASALTTSLQDISDYCLRDCIGCKETRPQHTYSEEDALKTSINFRN